MNFCDFKKYRFSYDKLNIHINVLLWVLGLLTGILLQNTCTQGANILFASVNAKTTFIASLVVTFPTVICSVILAYSMTLFCYPLVFVVGLCRGFCGTLVFSSFGGSAWLIRVFLLFSAAVSSTLMWWLLIRNKQANKRLILLTVLFSVALSLIDVYVVSPFLVNLF